MIEFIRDRRDGRWKVIEINGRPWLFVDFFRRCGLNYCELLVQDLLGSLDDQPMRQPAVEVLHPPHLHIDAEYACRQAFLDNKTSDTTQLQRWLDERPGALSFPYLDPNDEAPGIRQLAALAERWRVPYSALHQTLTSCVAGY